MTMKILYLGSDELACPALVKLLSDPFFEVVGVVSQPDKPSGRKLRITACPVKTLAEENGIPVLTPEKIGAQGSVEELKSLAPDIIAVAAYGQYIKPEVLAIPEFGSVNIHPSMLPLYRGASPIQWAIADGLKKTGVTILYVSEEMDAGDILIQEEVDIKAEDTAETLKPRLAEKGAELLIDVMKALYEGRAASRKQDELQSTYVKKLSKEDGFIDWSMAAEQISNRVRGFNPWPCCSCILPGPASERMKIFRVSIESGRGEPGAVLECGKEGPLVATSDCALRLLEVQPPGKKRMTGAAYLCGHGLNVGDLLR